jgi:UDP-2-acetamido-3-amino-2,3-dideoxy-glucuronate N-acetyltransferase
MTSPRLTPQISIKSPVNNELSVDPTAYIGPNCHLQGRIVIEADAVLIGGITLLGEVYIGKDTYIEPGVCLAASQTGFNRPTQAVRIGQKVHVGASSVLCGGVIIGNGAWIEPGTVVVRDIPPHAIVTGHPATIVGYTNPATDKTQRKANILVPPENHGILKGQVEGVALYNFPQIRDLRGNLSVGEFERDVPFIPKRYFLVFGVPSSETRGQHAHRKCHQFLVAVAGTVSVVVDDGTNREEVHLDRPTAGLMIPAGIWGIQYKYSENAVLLVFASDHYDAGDYIRNYDEFLHFRGVSA